MKRINFCVLILIAALLLISCVSTPKEQNQVAQTQTSVNYARIISHSYLDESNIGEVFNLRGKIIRNGENFVLIERPESRSQVSFLLEVDKKQKAELESLVNAQVEISGVLTSVASPWKKSIKVTAVSK